MNTYSGSGPGYSYTGKVDFEYKYIKSESPESDKPSNPSSQFVMYGLYLYLAPTPTPTPPFCTSPDPPTLLQDGHYLHPLREAAMNRGAEAAMVYSYTAVPNLAWGAGELRGNGEWVEMMFEGQVMCRFVIEKVVFKDGKLMRAVAVEEEEEEDTKMEGA